MTASVITSAAHAFDSRLATLEHLLNVGAAHLNEPDGEYLGHRLAPDMLPLGTQVAFTCNQPRNFALWLSGAPSDDLEPKVESMAVALGYLRDTRELVANHAIDHEIIPEHKHLKLGGGIYADLAGEEYIVDFLLPNFYFHLVTTY